MLSSGGNLPALGKLTKNINSVISENQFTAGPVIILSRESNDYATTFPSEIVTCQLADGSELQLLCKYSAGFNHNSYGHRGGVSYEADIYRHVLQKVQVTTPLFYGAHQDAVTGEIWLILEYFDEDLRVKASDNLTAMQAAARWLGKFHKENETLLSEASFPFLNRYDADYFRGWANRASQFAGDLRQSFPWLDTICQYFRENVDTLLGPQDNIIHGEYYPNNILFYQDNIFPVDWESAAIAVGEIDLASLIEKWPFDIARDCISIYQSIRWPEGPPTDFEQKMDASQLYWLFRWLGDQPERTLHPESSERFERLQVSGERLGLI
jgi:thiamine kinase-like enzyme